MPVKAILRNTVNMSNQSKIFVSSKCIWKFCFFLGRINLSCLFILIISVIHVLHYVSSKGVWKEQKLQLACAPLSDFNG